MPYILECLTGKECQRDRVWPWSVYSMQDQKASNIRRPKGLIPQTILCSKNCFVSLISFLNCLFALFLLGDSVLVWNVPPPSSTGWLQPCTLRSNDRLLVSDVVVLLFDAVTAASYRAKKKCWDSFFVVKLCQRQFITAGRSRTFNDLPLFAKLAFGLQQWLLQSPTNKHLN